MNWFIHNMNRTALNKIDALMETMPLPGCRRMIARMIAAA